MKRTSQALIACCAIASASVFAETASAQQACAPREKVTLKLEEKYSEKVVWRGLAPSGQALFELFVNEAGSWTVIVSDPHGQSCVVAVGESWERMPLLAGNPA